MNKQLALLLILTYGNCFSQNLILNHSFENTYSCPFDPSQIDKAVYWFQPSIDYSSSDLLNPCSIPQNVGVPVNFIGNQNPMTGIGYAGIYLYVESPVHYKEYIEGQLEAPLIEGNIYCVSFYVSLAELSSLAISKIGAYLSQDSLLYYGYEAITSVTPQIENSETSFLTNKMDWMKVSGYIIANGGERFITIGNFNTTLNTPIQSVAGGIYNASYYYIDDVSVINCDSLQSIGNLTKEDRFTIYPNPFNELISVELNNSIQSELTIYDISSRTLLLQTFTNSTTLNLEHLTKGIYIYTLRNKNGIIKKGKVIKE